MPEADVQGKSRVRTARVVAGLHGRNLSLRERTDEKKEGAEAPSSTEHTGAAQLIHSFTVSMLFLTHSSATSRGSFLSRPISRIH